MNLDFRSPAFIANPYPTYAKLRQKSPVYAFTPGSWLVTRYADADAILRNPCLGKDFDAALIRRYGSKMESEPAFRMVKSFMLLINPPTHTRLRTLASKAFSVRMTEEFRVLARQNADALVDAWIDRGEVELVEQFAYPLPIRVICTLLKVSFDHALAFQQDTQALIRTLELAPLNQAELTAANEAAVRFEQLFRDVLKQRRNSPGTDLVSRLLKAEEGGDRLSEDEIIANIVLLFAAGHETTANMIGNALVTLFRHPEQLRRLRQDHSLIPKAVEECLRLESSVQIAARAALQAVHLSGTEIPQDDYVYLALGAANRDPEVFPEPDQFSLDRPESTPKSLAFGGGAHYCLGARLARIELETALQTLLRRLPTLSINQLDQLQWKPTFTIRGLTQLEAQW